MNHPVMAIAQKNQVVKVGSAAMDPVREVVARSALRCGPEITRRARPTSMTVESEPSRMRVMVESQASLSTAFEEMGSENSISAAAAPQRPRRVSSEVVTWTFGR